MLQIVERRDKFPEIHFEKLGRTTVNPQRELTVVSGERHDVIEFVFSVERDRQLLFACGDFDRRDIVYFQQDRDNSRLRIMLLTIFAMERLNGLCGIAGRRIDVLGVALIDVIKTESHGPKQPRLQSPVLDPRRKVSRMCHIGHDRRKATDRRFRQLAVLPRPVSGHHVPELCLRCEVVMQNRWCVLRSIDFATLDTSLQSVDICSGLFNFRSGFADFVTSKNFIPFCGCDQSVGHRPVQVRVIRFHGQRDRNNLGQQSAQSHRHTGRHRPSFIWIAIVASLKDECFHVRLFVVDTSHAFPQHRSERGIFVGQQIARDRIRAHVMRLKERAEAVVVFLRDRIKLVIMAASTFQSQPQKCLTCLLDRFEHPHVAVKLVPVAAEKSRRTQHVGIGRSDLITGQHFNDHPVVRLVGIQRIHDPVPPAPDVALAVTDLIDPAAAVPVAVAPDIHPVPSPAFAVFRASQQIVDD